MHTIEPQNFSSRPISFDRFMSMYCGIPQNQDQSFQSERWYVLSECAKEIYSVVVYFCTFNRCILYHAQRVK
jgi:hypothetical protein